MLLLLGVASGLWWSRARSTSSCVPRLRATAMAGADVRGAAGRAAALDTREV
jgi:hypothetical protein